MSNDPRNAEVSFLDFGTHSRTPGPAEPSKIAALPSASGPPQLGPWLQSNLRASGPKDEAEYAERIAASRRLGLVVALTLVAFVSVIKWLAS